MGVWFWIVFALLYCKTIAQSSMWFSNLLCVCVWLDRRAIITETPLGTCGLFVLGPKHFCLVFTFGWKWGQCLRPWWEPTGMFLGCLSARQTRALTGTHTHTHSFLAAPPVCQQCVTSLGGNVGHMSPVQSLCSMCAVKLKVTFLSAVGNKRRPPDRLLNLTQHL